MAPYAIPYDLGKEENMETEQMLDTLDGLSDEKIPANVEELLDQDNIPEGLVQGVGAQFYFGDDKVYSLPYPRGIVLYGPRSTVEEILDKTSESWSIAQRLEENSSRR